MWTSSAEGHMFIWISCHIEFIWIFEYCLVPISRCEPSHHLLTLLYSLAMNFGIFRRRSPEVIDRASKAQNSSTAQGIKSGSS